MTRDLGVSSQFKFKGSLDVSEVYAEYDCLIHPSHMECMSLTILEALTAGLWVITTNVGGTLEIITHEQNGWLYEAGKTSELIKLLKDVEMAQNGNQALTYQNGSNLFAVENMVQDYFKLI